MGKSGEQEEMFLDVVSWIDNESDDEMVNNRNGGDNQNNTETKIPSFSYHNDASAEQNGNDDSDSDSEMTVQLPAESDDDTNDMENIQTQSSNKCGTAELQPQSQSSSSAAAVAAPPVAVPKVVLDHGMIILSEEKRCKRKYSAQHDNEPGKYVSSVNLIECKCVSKNNDDTKNCDASPQPHPKYKYAKLVSKPRSNPRV